MSDDLKYRVFPQEANHKTITLSKNERKHTGDFDFSEAQSFVAYIVGVFYDVLNRNR